MEHPVRRWLIGIAAVLLLGTGALVWLASTRLPSDEEVAARISEAFEKRFGVGLKIGGAHWALWPSPVLVLSQVATDQARPITLRRITLQLKLRKLLQRIVAVDEAEIESLVLPRESLRAFRGKGPKPKEGGPMFALPAPWALAPIPLENVRWRDVVWIDRRGIELAYDGDIVFDTHWRPRQARVERAGASPPARLRLDREAGRDRWRTRIDVGGGTWNGVSLFELLPNDTMRVSAELEPRQIDIEGLVQAFGRRTAVAGKFSGQTTLVAQAGELGALIRSLHTRTTFSVKPATLTRLDLAKAVTTAGISRGGTTPLDELTGTLDTQGGEDGIVMRYTGLKARSGLLTASGNLKLFNRKLDGEVAVDLVDGVVGVPLKVGGSMSDPEVSLTGGALAGAAVGTAVLPGVGTAIGARIGQQVEKLFGEEEPAKKKTVPPQPQRSPGVSR
ncbi:AsmA-like C-terminal region-containing protein [Variovorax sp. OV700]|uniref:AsmA-like C-terminal region-containing protein n=1 Tax=Variovorax sp. OV700 TaxID=1882826 RepID=UPI00088A6724|nr:AsmA-like C-terminal region-containing protein [Variovorax sp. OV700]SDJ38071.1 AsmA-like C-terminal region [Variovorax sp. OV700]